MNEKDWQKCIDFHGHECPGLAIGFQACELAHKLLDERFSPDEEIVCVTENDACGVDAIQVLMGCSFGKGNLLYKDTGKQAYSFFKRKTGEGVRLVFKGGLKMDMDRQKKQQQILNASPSELFDVKKTNVTLPEKARFFASVVCEICGEKAPEQKMRLQDGKKVCLDCFKDYKRSWCH